MSDSNIKSYALIIAGVVMALNGFPFSGIVCIAIGIFL